MKSPLYLKMLVVFFFLLSVNYGHAQIITSFAGGIGECRDAFTYGRLSGPGGVVIDAAGNITIADNNNLCLRKVDAATGVINTIYRYPSSIQVTAMTNDAAGNLYLAFVNYIVKISSTGSVITIAGTGTTGFSGDGSQATAANLASVKGLALDGSGNLYLTDYGNGRIRKVGTDGIINTLAGGGTGGDGGLAILSAVDHPLGVVVDGVGNLYFSEEFHSNIRKINTSGIVSTFAAGVTFRQLTIDGAGFIYGADLFIVRRVNAAGVYTVFAGAALGFGGDGGPATAASFNTIQDIKFDATGNAYIVDGSNNRIRKVNTSGIVTTIIGNGLDASGFAGDGGPALLATFNNGTITTDRQGNLFLTDATSERVRKIATSGIVSTVAGCGVLGFGGDGGPATAGILGNPGAVATDNFGNLYIGDVNTGHIRMVNSSGIISTIGGGGASGLGDGGPATAAQTSVSNIVSDSVGNIYIADAMNQRIRKIKALTGIISTIAGNGTPASTGDNGPATAATVFNPSGIAIDRTGNLFFVDNGSRLRKIDNAGMITTVAGGGSISSGDGPATSAQVYPTSISIDKWGNIYIQDGRHEVFKVDGQGYLHLVAGNGSAISSGDCGPATNAGIATPNGISVDTAENLYIMDGSFVRKVCCMTNTTGHPPAFTHSANQTMSLCASASAMSIDTFLAISGPLPGNSITWSVYSAPAHGTIGGFSETLTTASGVTTPSGLTYTPTPGYTGTDNFMIKVSDGDYANYMRITVTVSPMPTAITGTGILCAGNTVNLSGTAAGGTWTSSNIAVASVGSATGLIGGVSAGTARISYTLSGICSISTIVTVNNAVAPISGTTSICMGTPVTLSSGTGGSWSSSSISKATIGSASGVVTPVSSGTSTISYTLSSSCYAVTVITVNPLPNIGSISGGPNVCTGATITMTNPAPGGIWSVTNGHASISATGVLTGISAGAVNVSYTVINVCAASADIHAITVVAVPVAGTITGPSIVCPGNSIFLSNVSHVGPGAWSCGSPYIAIGSISGVVAGIAAGTATVSYTASNSCGAAVATSIITVNPMPTAGSISGITSICTGGTSTLTSSVPGGVWSSGNPFVAPVTSGGVVSGNAAGAALISYTVSSAGCGTAVAVAIVNIAAAASILPVTGPGSICSGTTATLNDASPGGVWSSSNPSVASVGSSSGIVTGVVAGVVTISYSANLGCGLSVATSNLVVNPFPDAGVITGTATLCTDASDLLTSTALGGVWSSSNANTTVSPTGLVTGVSVGASTISYTVTNSCGAATATHTINLYLTPIAGSLSGASSLCTGASSTFANISGSSGGVWSTGDAAIATVNSAGSATGVSIGTTVISYTVTTGCGIAYATKILTVTASSAGLITGVTTFCAGGSGVLSSTIAGGTWSTATPAVATVASTGLLTAIAGGTAIVSYVVSGACGTAVGTVSVTVGSLPVVSPVVGVHAMCLGTTTVFTDGTFAGAWSSSNPLIAAIGSTGTVTSLAAGSTVISYMVTAGCGTAGATTTLNVEVPPIASAVSGVAALCAGSSAALMPGITGGTWSSSNILVATVGTAGIVTGTGTGNTTITYTITNTCGSIATMKDMTIDVLTAGTLTGVSGLCPGSNSSLINSLPGGTWSSSASSVATVGSSGNVAALASGTTVISYALTNSCGTAYTMHPMTIYPVPDAGTISGALSLCTGLSTPLLVTGGIGGGSWSSSNTLLATIGTTGIVTGINPGTVLLSYSVNNACGSATATKEMTINLLTAGTINGITTICPGGSITLSSTVPGGTWGSSDPTVATISAGGVVSAIATGATVISYAVTGACGTVTETIVFTVSSLPIISPIDGVSDICAGTTTVYTNPTIGGMWSSSDPSVATVGSTGVVTGVAPGICTISYTVTAGCGASASAVALHVAGMPDAGTISGNVPVCAGATVQLQSSVTGGTWAIDNPLKASIDELTGAVTGLSAGIVDVTYTFTNSCGSVTTVVVEPVITLPDAGGITGATSLCEQSTIALADGISGGVWTSGNSTVARISSQGEVVGVTPGTAVISYAVSNVCGISYAKVTLNVNQLPFIPAIAGGKSVTKGSAVALSNAIPGGNWSSGDTTIATIGSDGLARGVSVGEAIITYSASNSFGCNSFITAVLEVTTDSIGNNIQPNIGINIYPNPATYELTISWQNQLPSNADVRIMDVAAKDVLRTSFAMQSAKGTARMSIDGLSGGVYTITIKSANENYTGKLVIVK